LLKVLFGIVAAFCIASTRAVAIDATWYCYALIGESGTKPWKLKYVVKGGELIDQEVVKNDFLEATGAGGGEKITTKYKVIKDTDIGLIAVHSDTETNYVTKETTMSVRVIMIDKASSNLVLQDITSKSSERYVGSCQVGK
jgi:hypothetical protein